jgi:hypothetical protein
LNIVDKIPEDNQDKQERDSIVSVCTRIEDRVEELEQRLSPILLELEADESKSDSSNSSHYRLLSTIEDRLLQIIGRLNL